MPIQTIPFEVVVREVPPTPGFLAAIAPTTQSILAGATAAAQVSFVDVAGYTNDITLRVLNLPEGAHAEFGLNPCKVTDVVSVVVTGLPVGAWALLLEAAGDDMPPVAVAKK